MPVPAAVAEPGAAYSGTREQLVAYALGQTAIAGRALDGGDAEAWRDAVAGVGGGLLEVQRTAVELADPYLDDVLDAQGLDTAAEARVAADEFVDQTDGGGSWLRNLVYAPISTYQAAIVGGAVGSVAAARARFVASAIVLDGIRDMYRAADVTAALTRPSVYGYVRALRGKSCGRCAVLAGRRYRTGRSFRRHKLCDCYMIPTGEDAGSDWTTSPRRYFNRLTPAERVEVFGEAGARAIAAGADISQVVNAYEGVQVGATTTTAGTTRRGLYGGYEVGSDGSLVKRSGPAPPRLLPDEIFAQAEHEGWSREQTLAALQRFGYVI